MLYFFLKYYILFYFLGLQDDIKILGCAKSASIKKFISSKKFFVEKNFFYLLTYFNMYRKINFKL